MNKSKKALTSTITLNNKKYNYSLKKVDKHTTYVKCEAANIAQPFDNDDLAELLFHLPDYIVEAQKEQKKDATEIIRFRVLSSEKKIIQKNALKMGYNNVSSFLRDIALAGT